MGRRGKIKPAKSLMGVKGGIKRMINESIRKKKNKW
jgi:hypothetical protein